MTIRCRRDDFSDFGDWTYLNCAYQGPLPRVSAEAVQSALRIKQQPFQLEEGRIREVPNEVRAVAARLIGARDDEIAIANGTGHGTNLAAAGLPLGRGDEVLLGPTEFPSNRLPWLHHGARRGYTARAIRPAGRWTEVADFERESTPATRAVSVAAVAHSTGYRFDLAGLSALCRERGWFLVVDACQAVGNIPLSVADLRPDLLATGGYKWLLGPYGTGFTYVRKDLVDDLEVSVVNWMGMKGAEDFSSLLTQEPVFADGARRFDVPETASFLNLAGLGRSLEYLLEVGIDAVEAHHRHLTDRLIAGLPSGYRLVSDPRPERRSGVVCIAGPGPAATRDAHARLRAAKVHVSLREDSIRVSPNVYNDDGDIDRLLGHL